MCGDNYQVFPFTGTEDEMWKLVATHCGDLGSDDIREPNAHIDPDELNIINQNPENYFRENNGKVIDGYEPIVIAIKKGTLIDPEPNNDGEIIYEFDRFNIVDFYEEIVTAFKNKEVDEKTLADNNIEITDTLTEGKDKIYNKYYYEGPLYSYSRIWAAEWSGETTASSYAEAFRNLNEQAKRRFNLYSGFNLYVDRDKIIKLRTVNKKQSDFKPDAPVTNRYCDRCHRNILNDQGECPWCDYEDEDYAPNNMNEGLVKNISSNTPYMLTREGELLTCGDIHPYIKMSHSYDLKKNITELLNHKDFIPWFYNNTSDEDTFRLIGEFLNKANEEGYEKALDYIDLLGIEKENTDKTLDSLFEELANKTNEEFCKVRTSNIRYRYGGDNGEIYFRIPSSFSEWFNAIWYAAFKYADYITNITIVKDPGSMSQPFSVEYCKVDGKDIKKYPLDDFLKIGSNPRLE